MGLTGSCYPLCTPIILFPPLTLALIGDLKNAHSRGELFGKNRYQLVRFTIPLCFIGIVMLGYTSYWILNSLDSHSTLSSEKLFRNLVLLGVVFGIWWIQHIFAPTLLSLAASWAIYNGIVHGSYSLIPIFGFVTEHLLSWGPSWIAEFYTLSSIGYSLVCVVLSFESIDEVLDIFG